MLVITGQYQCFAENEWGTATSNSVFVRKAELNSFKDGPPIRENAQEGDPFKLVCQPPDGWPKPNVYWLIQNADGGIKSINNSRMTLDPEGNLWFSNVTRHDASDDFYYACAATSVFRNEYKVGNRVTLNVVPTGTSASQNRHEPVQQYVTRKNEVALRGRKVELYCIFGGTPLPQTVWSKDGQQIRTSDRVTQNNYGKTVPYFTEEPEIINAAEDETVEFKCKASGIPEPQIKWIHNGKPISEAPPNPRRKVTPNSIVIEKLQKKDTGNYGCNATNSLGYVYKDVYVNVLALAPEITDPPGKEATVDGRTVTMTCRVFGAPKPQVKWVHGHVELTGGRYSILDNGDLEIRQTICGLLTNHEASRRSKCLFNSFKLLFFRDVTYTDAGNYTCLAENKFGDAKAEGSLIVKDVPNPPNFISLNCNKHDASIHWQPMGDNRAPILHYTIQYNTSFTPDTWEVAYDEVPATEMTYTVAMSPWANYTFRVIAWNKIGPSQPSQHSSVCTTQPDVPYKNPDNVEGKGTDPNNIVISWTPMPEIEHNAPRFTYRVYWKRDIPGEQWVSNDIQNWEETKLVVNDQPTFQRYRIKVVAMNEKGEANVAPKEVIGYSGEDVPTQAPTNFTLVQVKDSTTALLSWFPVPPETVRGHFKGYKIQIWTEKDGEDGLREIDVKGEQTNTMVTKFIPHMPGTVQFFEAFPLGTSALYLIWKRPEQPNGILTGYKIYYQTVKGTKVGPILEREPHISDPNQTRAKLAGLEPGTKYRLHIKATTNAGEGEAYFIEQRTRSRNSAAGVPDKPKFSWSKLASEEGYAKIKVVWLPNIEGLLGSHFFVKYKKKGETQFLSTDPEMNEDFIIVRGLMPGEMYEFSVVAVDGEHMTESEIEEVEISSMDSIIIKPKENVATAGWFIGMMLAIAFLLLVLIIVCIIKRNRGGKYAVHEREAAHGRTDYPEEPGFHEYSQPLDNKSHGRGSMSSDPKAAPESDTDSMAEYGDGDTGRFTEDGSFIGQYGPGNKRRPEEQQSPSAIATYV
ncbi:Neuroglian [Blattella germanica]|nr:Neuroglian [Blattella germanica]